MSMDELFGSEEPVVILSPAGREWRRLACLYSAEAKALRKGNPPDQRAAETGCVGVGSHRERGFGHYQGGNMPGPQVGRCTASEAVRAEVRHG